MSKVYSIEQLRREYLVQRTEKDPSEYMARQQELIERLIKENEELKEQLIATPVITQDNSEELICLEQIKILKEHSAKRELDINEVKKLDLLIKNLKLLQATPTTLDVNNIRDVNEVDLVAIASGKYDKN